MSEQVTTQETPEVTTEKGRKVTRRRFLIAAGAVGAALVVGVPLVGLPYVRRQLAGWLESSGGPPGSVDAVPTAWFEINPDNRVRLYIPKVEMGQAVHTSLAQIAADELEAAWEQVEVVQARTGQGLDDPIGTSASTSVSSLYLVLREAGATVREMLRAEAARQLGRPVDELVAREGAVFVQNSPDTRLTYGEIVQKAQAWEVPEEPAALKPDGELRLIGQPLPRVDLPAKVVGEASYGIDVRLPDMLYGAVAHPPTIEGKLRRAAPGAAESMPGVVAVVIEEGFAGVVAERRDQAYDALAALEIEWDPGRTWQQADIDAMVTVGNGNGVTIQDEGDAPGVLRTATAVEAEYRTPMAYQAHMEPQSSVVHVQPDRVQVWTSTQSAMRVRGFVAGVLDREEETVEVTPTYLGGGFGHKILTTTAEEAARLSNAVSRPVHVVWNRPDDFQNGFVRPPTHHRLRGAVTADGRIEAVEHLQASGEVAFPFLPGIMSTVMGADFGAWRGAFINYRVPNRRTVAWLADLPVSTGWWRGLGLLANTFALESFMDELAAAAGVDPLELRLRHLPDSEIGERLGNALRMAAERAGWGATPPDGRALGVACCADVGTVIAQVAEVSLAEGRPRVHKVTAVVDPGLVVNPDGAAAQIEGAIVMGLSSTLFEEVRVADGALTPPNFGAYRLLTMADAPDVDVHLVSSGSQPRGLGEPPIGPIAPAVANAFYSLTGQRLRQLPLRTA